MSTPAAKRRRIDAASQTLAKPFRSPFKTPFKSPVKASASQDNTSTAAQGKNPLAPKNTNSLLSSRSKTPSLPAPPASFATPARSPGAKKTFSSPVQAAALNADPNIAPLLRLQRELDKQLREVKEELETAQQARKIEADSAKKDPNGEIDGELVELIDKWKAASRQAAEELFGKVRDRVNRYVISPTWPGAAWLTFLQDGRPQSLEGDAEKAAGISKQLGPGRSAEW
jgi:Swi5-dependent recombination DNA repair protein 1